MKTLKKLLTKLRMKGGEVQMKNLTILVVVAMLLAPAYAFADIAIDVTGDIVGGSSVSGPVIYKCPGYKATPTMNPVAVCTTTTTMGFGSLIRMLKNASGQDTEPAGCFYGENFFVVYLYPDAWGGRGYELKQKSATINNAAVGAALQMTPVYAKEDQFRYPDGRFVAQGTLTTTEANMNLQLNKPVLAVNAADAMILKAKRARIVRAEYGIPPFPAEGDTRAAGWAAVPLTTPETASITGKVIFSLTEW